MKILNKAWFDPWGTPAVTSYVQQNEKNKLTAMQGYWEQYELQGYQRLQHLRYFNHLKNLSCEIWITVMQSNYTQLSQAFRALVPATHPEENQEQPVWHTETQEDRRLLLFILIRKEGLHHLLVFPRGPINHMKMLFWHHKTACEAQIPYDTAINSFPILKSLIQQIF